MASFECFTLWQMFHDIQISAFNVHTLMMFDPNWNSPVCVLITLLIFPGCVIQNRSTHQVLKQIKRLNLYFYLSLIISSLSEIIKFICVLSSVSVSVSLSVLSPFLSIFRELLSLRDPRLDWSSTSLQIQLSLEERERGKGASKHLLRKVGWVKSWNSYKYI